MSKQPSWVKVSPMLRGSLLSEAPTIIHEDDGIYVNGQRALEHYELTSGIVVLGLADGAVLTSRAEFLQAGAGITLDEEAATDDPAEGSEPSPPSSPLPV